MRLNSLKPGKGARQDRKRVGRGIGSGLGKLNSMSELKDSPQVRGLINKVHYLVRVEE